MGQPKQFCSPMYFNSFKRKLIMTASARISIGNAAISGFVNHVASGRFIVGTGSYQSNGEKVFKASVTVFTDAKFDGTIPEKGDYVKLTGDITVTPRNDKPEELNATMNVRFANQVEKIAAPVAKADAAAAPAGDRDI